MFTLYKIVNSFNSEFYIGVHETNNPYDGYMGSGVRIERAIKKYGRTNFSKEILAIYDVSEEAYLIEKWLLSFCRQNVECLNLSDGGIGGANFKGRNHTAESKAATGRAVAARIQSEAERRKRSESTKRRYAEFGRQSHSLESKKKISESIRLWHLKRKESKI